MSYMLTVRSLQHGDIDSIVELDKKWFGSFGISRQELIGLVDNNSFDLVVLLSDTVLLGFASCEVVQNQLPSQYVGDAVFSEKTLFIQQFTTYTNYAINDFQIDDVLLRELEQLAKNRNCRRICEALAQNHPYKKEINPKHDAYGFYLGRGYSIEHAYAISWHSGKYLDVPCFLFTKELREKVYKNE